jgi:hypothetical protein
MRFMIAVCWLDIQSRGMKSPLSKMTAGVRPGPGNGSGVTGALVSVQKPLLQNSSLAVSLAPDAL